MLRNIGATPLNVLRFLPFLWLSFFSLTDALHVDVRAFFWLLFWINSAEIHYLKNLPQCCATLGAPPPMLRNIARHLPNVVQQNGYALLSPIWRNIRATPPMLRNIAAISTNAVQHWFHFLDTLVTGCNVLLCGVLALAVCFLVDSSGSRAHKNKHWLLQHATTAPLLSQTT